MDTILVISNEPALAETLGSELAECSLQTARWEEAATALHEEAFRLILADEAGGNPALLAGAKASVLTLARPIRLSDLLYTIRLRLQSKSAPAREEAPLAPGFVLSASERHIRSLDGQQRIALTEKEVELLYCLIEERTAPLAREALLSRVWGYGADIDTHTLETHIYRLRGKLRQARETLDIVSDGGGYRLSE